MAIKTSSTVIVSDSRVLSNITDLDTTTRTIFGSGIKSIGNDANWILTSKTANVTYQNNYNKPILVTIVFSGSAQYFWYGPNTSSLEVGGGAWFYGEHATASIIIPDNWYYKTNASDITSWYELR